MGLMQSGMYFYITGYKPNKFIMITEKLIIQSIEEYEKLPPKERRELKKLVKLIGNSLSKIFTLIHQNNCEHYPEEIDTCCIKYTRCKKCNALMSDIVKKYPEG